VDKTGTLTQNRMTVRELIVDGETCALQEAGLPERFHEISEFAVLASPIDPFDPMDTAFKVLGERYLAETEHLHSDWTLVREYPLSEHLLALSHVWRSPSGNEYVIAAKGAPEAIADLCHFDAVRLADLTSRVEAATQNGSGYSAWPGRSSASQTACPPNSTTSTLSSWDSSGFTTPCAKGFLRRLPSAPAPACVPS
jgi:Ca2+-transporting ATPase